ncbi:MAG TPA: DUF4149 domain-containing protein [Thermoanaerobaculia bacterium]|nr:DUF4149 domain-containing protein [Thermoanaerobaculia bacterium]
MPNWYYVAVSFLYNASLAIWLGGALMLGAVAAPAIFETSESRSRAGATFGEILRRFSIVRVAALVVIILSAATKFFVWESNLTPLSGAALWLAVRWLAIVAMAAILLYELFYLRRVMDQRRAKMSEAHEEGERARFEFQRLHHRAESLMKGAIVASAVALLLN